MQSYILYNASMPFLCGFAKLAKMYAGILDKRMLACYHEAAIEKQAEPETPDGRAEKPRRENDMASKKEIYAAHGINYKAGKIEAPVFGFIAPLLIDGNSKLGKGVWTFSTLPGTAAVTVDVNGTEYTAAGTCPCNCKGCYAQTGFYRMPSVIQANAVKTILSRDHADFVRRAIIAQIEAEGIRLVRIHASGDFFSAEYINTWREIVKASPDCLFWTYTKNSAAESAFDDLDNINIVKSIIHGVGFNFGHCGYILRVYETLKAQGKSVYICRCGIDKDQHCMNCKGCATNDFVLFLEHSTSYKAESDPLFPSVKALIEAQAAM